MIYDFIGEGGFILFLFFVLLSFPSLAHGFADDGWPTTGGKPQEGGVV